MTDSINYIIKNGEFPDKSKKLEVILLNKKEDPLKKEKYRLVSLLPHVSKVFERVIHEQINSYEEDKPSKYITGFRKAHGTQHSLITTLEIWKSVLDKGEYVCCLFIESLALMCCYLKNRKQRMQINNYFSSEKKVLVGVPQGSVDGPLFDLFINDLFLFLTQCFLSNYADDNNLYSAGNNL